MDEKRKGRNTETRSSGASLGLGPNRLVFDDFTPRLPHLGPKSFLACGALKGDLRRTADP